MLQNLFSIQEDLLSSLDLTGKRYLFDEMNWKNRFTILVGMRGVGKTTLLLQYIKENFPASDKALYISGDNTILNNEGLFQLGQQFYQNGGKLLIVDEVHKYPSWNQELKNLYDSFPELRLIASGSSSLDIIKGQYDLSRRAVIYYLNGLSFREFVNLELKTSFEPHSLSEILTHHFQIASTIKTQSEKQGGKIIRLFQNYLAYGYYPYYLEGKNEYYSKLQNAISKVLYEDIPSIFHTKQQHAPFLHKLIYLVATSSPFQPNISRISSNLGLSKEYVYHYLDYLEKAGLFLFLSKPTAGLKLIRKPDKIYLNNSNLCHAIVRQKSTPANNGSMHEAFVLNQMKIRHKVTDDHEADFYVDNKYRLEIGGKNKGKEQIKESKNAFVFKDDIEIGHKNVLPLYLLGFLY